MISLRDIIFGDRKMIKKIWEGNHAGDRTFASVTMVGRKGMKRTMRIRGVSILIALLSIAAAFPSVLAGSDVVIVRHPESVRILRSFIDLMISGGMAMGVQGISKRIDIPKVDHGKG